MNGQICFSIKNKNVSILVENSEIVEHTIYENESNFSKITYFNTNGSDMTEEEYNRFYNENSQLVEFLADLEIEL